MPIKTKRWNDPPEADDGCRLLVCRYWPRGLRKEKKTWDDWRKELAPSKQLHADFYGKHGPPIGWETYRTRYLDQIRAQMEELAALADRVAAGETITLLCSSACKDAAHCHRTLLKEQIEALVVKRHGRSGEHASGG